MAILNVVVSTVKSRPPTLPRCMKHGAKTVLELFKQSMGLGTEQE
jgi:hypothetical protein